MKRYCILYFFLLGFSNCLLAQSQISVINKSDSSIAPSLKWNQQIKNKILKGISGGSLSLIDTNREVIANNIALLHQYDGKEINTIVIEQHNFSTNINLPQLNSKDFFTRTANQLHISSNDATIRRNLFFKPNETFNPTVIAYNEKWLRDLPFLQDARIVATILPYDTNKVDVYVISKDILPYGGQVNIRNENAYQANVSNANLWGMGHLIQINHNFDKNRNPNPGWGYDIKLRNLFGSFINLNGGINDVSNNIVNNEPSSFKQYISGDLALLNPFSNWTGGFEFSNFKNKNLYPTLWSDSLFKNQLQYENDYIDFWLGYQLFPKNKNKKSFRRFILIRHLENHFEERPIYYLDQLDKNYQNINAQFLAFTLFKQEVVRTKYLYGFGRNEDLPVGQSITFTAAAYQREQTQLPYLGIRYEKYVLHSNGDYTHLLLNGGSSYFENNIQDFRWLSSIEKISKLKYFDNGIGYRNILNISFTQTLKNKFNEALLINSIYGIPQLNKERIKGGTRISANWETNIYNSKQWFGFKHAPFVFANVTYIRTVGDPFKMGDIYTAIGSGIRVRNENLIFGTIELKSYYFPRTQYQLSPWNISLSTNFRFKYNSSILTKPDFVEIN